MFCVAGWRLTKIVFCISGSAISIRINTTRTCAVPVVCSWCYQSRRWVRFLCLYADAFRFINTSAWLNPPSYWNRWRTASPESKPGWPATDYALIPPKRKSFGSDLLVVWRNALPTLWSCLAPPSNQFLVSVTSELSSTKTCPSRHTWAT